jgi:phage anti-repressor protein
LEYQEKRLTHGLGLGKLLSAMFHLEPIILNLERNSASSKIASAKWPGYYRKQRRLLMNELIKLNPKNKQFPVDARELHEKLQVGRDFSTWLKERIEQYGFSAGQDFSPNPGKTQKGSKGGRPTIEYELSLDMGKELAMVENNDAGRAVRRYFITIENEWRTSYTELSKIIRHELTDALKESGLNEKMHGFGYKTFTDLIYKLVLGMDAKHYRIAFGLEADANVRQHITEFQRIQIGKLEKAVQVWIDLGYNYQEIKDMLSQKFLPN